MNDTIALLLVCTQILMIVVSVVFLVSGLADVFIDVCYVCRRLYRRLFIMPKYAPLTEEQLRQQPEQLIAIMLPAWDESAVIRPMLLNIIRSLDYEHYHIMVGTYPNDLETQREVDYVKEQHNHVHRITCPHKGPTNKADCLNWIYQGIKLLEKEQHLHFDIFVMQDCEDVIHPLSYKLFNYLIPRKDMVQLPVHSLPRKWYAFTAGHYIDEFAQLHLKDLTVREMLNKSVPAAGVGCAFSRRAFETIAASNKNQVFSIDSLTEDYDFGFRLKRHGLKQIFVNFSLPRTVTTPAIGTRKPRQRTTRELVCIREYFPSTFKAAVRQKSRWVVGIALQGWAHLGWRGSGWTKYMLYRDRKALFTNLVNMLGYGVVAVVVALWVNRWVNPDAYRYPPLLQQGTWVWYLVLANFGLVIERVGMRMYCVQRLHGWPQAFLSVCRIIWGNVINFCATCRAIKLYVRYLRTGQLIAWDKTAHVFPSEAELLRFRPKLGTLLLAKRLITMAQLEEALQQQTQQYRPLGAILIDMHVITEADLEQALNAA
jgi:adsorption protein B